MSDQRAAAILEKIKFLESSPEFADFQVQRITDYDGSLIHVRLIPRANIEHALSQPAGV